MHTESTLSVEEPQLRRRRLDSCHEFDVYKLTAWLHSEVGMLAFCAIRSFVYPIRLDVSPPTFILTIRTVASVQ